MSTPKKHEGQRITSFAALEAAAKSRQSVIAPSWRSAKPAAWVMNMNAGDVNRYLKHGLTIYTPKRPRKQSRAESDLIFAVEVLQQIATPNYAKDPVRTIESARKRAESALKFLGMEVRA